MRFRLAKLCDCDQLAEVHFACCSEQPEGFMFKLGKSFLSKYYQIFLNEENSVVIVAENETGQITGFHSGTLKAEEHIAALRRHRLSLLVASVRAILRHPYLLRSMYIRYSATGNKGEFIITSGPRGEYWAWLSSEKNPGAALALHRTWHEFMKLLGVKAVRSELNAENKRVFKATQLMGAHIVREFETPEGHKRYIMEYILDKMK